jgi:hypothetical protein
MLGVLAERCNDAQRVFPLRPPVLFRALGIAFAVVAVIGIGVDLLSNLSSDERTVEFALFVACTAWMLSAISKWKKRNIAPPTLITIDDSGLWLRKIGELMRWSEIQSVKISYWGGDACTVVWQHSSNRLHHHAYYGDHVGKMWLPVSVYGEIKSYRERYRTAAASQGVYLNAKGVRTSSA